MSSPTDVETVLDGLGVRRFHVMAACVAGLANAAVAAWVISLGFALPEMGATEAQASTVSASTFAGMLLGGLVGGALADAVGRTPVLSVGLALLAVGNTALASWSFNFWTIAATRAVGGVGAGAATPALYSLYAEYMPSAKRGLFMAVLGMWWTAGYLTATLLAFLVLNSATGVPGALAVTTDGNPVPDLLGSTESITPWRVFTLSISGMAALALVLCVALLPESPRWLARARPSLKATNHVLDVMRGTHSHLAKHFAHVEGTQHALVRVEHDNGVRDLWTRRVLRRRFRTMAAAFLATSFGLSGLTMWLPTIVRQLDASMDAYFVVGVGLAGAIPGNLLSIWLMHRPRGAWPNHAQTLILGALGVTACMTPLVFTAVSSSTAAVLGLTFGPNVCTRLLWNAINTLTSELFPTTLGGSASALLSSLGRVAALVAMPTFSSMAASTPGNVFMVVALSTVATATVIYVGLDTTVLPDMRGVTLLGDVKAVLRHAVKLTEVPLTAAERSERRRARVEKVRLLARQDDDDDDDDVTAVS